MIGGGSALGVVQFPVNGWVVMGTAQPQPCAILCSNMSGKKASVSLLKADAASCVDIANLFTDESEAVAQWRKNVMAEISRLSALTYPAAPGT